MSNVMKMRLCGTFCLLLTVFCLTIQGLPERCTSSLACRDPGQLCVGGQCVCVADIGPEALQFWSCDNVMDCEGPIRFASDQLSYAGHTLAVDTMNLEEPSCVASTECPNLSGRFGYCDVFWPDGDALPGLGGL